MRACYAAAGCDVSLEEVSVIPFWVVRTMASVGEWVFWVCTLGRVTPAMRREDIDHLDTGCWWSVEKAGRVLEYEPVCGQDEAIGSSMEWGMKMCS